MSGKKTNDDTSKYGVMIQRVICEVGSGSRYLTLTKTNYSDWALLIKLKLKAWALWSVIEDSGTNQQEDMIALYILCDVVPPEMVLTIAKNEMVKEAWDAIATITVGDDRMKKATSPRSMMVRPSRTTDYTQAVWWRTTPCSVRR
jgi:hypothetical protein